jgi:hypothetical protein
MGGAMIALRPAIADDVPLILQFIRDLAAYEKLLPGVEATTERLRAPLFPATGRSAAECVLAFCDDQPADAPPRKCAGYSMIRLVPRPFSRSA